MSPAATTSSRRATSARRPAGTPGRAPVRRRAVRARRRRWASALIAAIVLGAIVYAVTSPAGRRAVDQFRLPLHYSSVIRQQAADKHLDPALVAGVIYAETKFDARTSPAGALGLMQIEPQTADLIARRSGATTFTTADLGTPQVNIAYGSYYLRYLLDRYHDSTVLALAAYNGGMGNVDRWQARARAAGHDLMVSEIPFPETRAYVERVLRAQRDYRHTYARQLGYT